MKSSLELFVCSGERDQRSKVVLNPEVCRVPHLPPGILVLVIVLAFTCLALPARMGHTLTQHNTNPVN